MTKDYNTTSTEYRVSQHKSRILKQIQEIYKHHTYTKDKKGKNNNIKHLEMREPQLPAEGRKTATHTTGRFHSYNHNTNTHKIMLPSSTTDYLLSKVDDIAKFLTLLDNLDSIEELKQTWSQLFSTADDHAYVTEKLSETGEVFSIYTIESLHAVIISHSGYTIGDPKETLSTITEEIKQRAKDSNVNLLSLEFYLTVILTLIVAIMSNHDITTMQDTIVKKLQDTQEAIIKQIHQYSTSKISDTYYIVTRSVNMRVKPSTKKSRILAVLYPNQLVKLLERKGKWIKVEYHNSLFKIRQEGWCYKKYLKMLKTNRHQIR